MNTLEQFMNVNLLMLFGKPSDNFSELTKENAIVGMLKKDEKIKKC